MKWKWQLGFLNLRGENNELLAQVSKSGPFLKPEISISKDPRTGKPWKSMKAAREWFDEVTGRNLPKYRIASQIETESERDKAKAEAQRLRKGLEFYADEEGYHFEIVFATGEEKLGKAIEDGGAIARQAIKPTEEREGHDPFNP